MAEQQKQRIWLSPPHMGGKEIDFINEAFETNWVAPVGPHITAFEDELVEYSGTDYCAALSSGTAAIHLALIILGVQAGDEVICSSFTFSGSCNPVIYLKAQPVFIDAEQDTWNMDPVLLEQAIEDRLKKTGKMPKAIILVHLYGMPAKLEEITRVARKYEIPIVEDAAEALGSSYKDKKLGTFGSLGVYSFNGNKIITTSGGGALLSKNEAWIKKARFFATQARDPAPHYEHSEIGYNYRLSNISAAIGRGQLRLLDERVRQRRSNFEHYRHQLGGIEFLTFVEEPKFASSNRWLTTILINKSSGRTPRQLQQALEDENIESRPLWKPMHKQPVFRDSICYENGTSMRFFESGLCLPSGSNLTKFDLDRVCDIIAKFSVTKA